MSGPVRELVASLVQVFSLLGDELGVGRLSWPNVATGDVLTVDGGGLVRVVAIVPAPPGSSVGACVTVAGCGRLAGTR
jgi:hypothetical protein